MSRKRWLDLLRVAVSGGLLALLFTRVDLAGVGRALGRADGWLLLAALGIGHADRVLQAEKWRLLLRSSGTRIGHGAAIANTYVGNFAGQFLPSGVGGDVVRVWLLREMKLSTTEVIASILVERGFGVLALVFTAGGAVVLARAIGIELPSRLAWAILGVAGPLFLVTLASFRLDVDRMLAWIGRVGSRFSLGEKATQLTAAYRSYGKRKRVLLSYLALSVVEVAMVSLVFSVCIRAMGSEVGMVPLLAVIPTLLFLQRLPISINGLGVSEGALTWLLVQLGETKEVGLAVAILMRLLEVTIILPGGLLWWRRPRSPAAPGG